MADVIFNHVGNCKGGYYDFSCIDPFSHKEDYHTDCTDGN